MPAEPSHRAERSHREAGFTLIEVLAVLAILAVALGILAGRGPAGSAALDARGAADQVARAMRLARSQAIAANRDVAVTLDVAGRAIRVGDAPRQALPATVDFTVTAVQGETASSLRIVFAPDGGSTGGRVRLAGGAVRRVVAVDWLSGRVVVSDGG